MGEVVSLDEPEGFRDPDEVKSSATVLAALRKAEDAFRDWQATCQVIDQVYNLEGTDLERFGWRDAELDLFWSSFEVLKPAIYARPPQPVVAPLFKDGKPLHNLTAELLERCAISVFKRTDINDVMLHLRDDLVFAGRGVPWLRYEKEDGEHRVCVEHKDRLDFLHEPARKWAEVGWVASAAWMTKREMRTRFRSTSGDAYQDASYTVERDREDQTVEKRATVRKAKVWEVWHRADNKVYWVTEGVSVLLDSDKPHLDLTGFFPCPKPAYATLRRRSLIPVPDYERYSVHFRQISELTRRIYSLLEKVRMKGLIPAGGDVGDAVEALIADDRDDQMLVPVPGASMLADGANSFVAWLPLSDLATAIQGLIEARNQLIQDFFQLSGISDIMRGATDADETLGAQELKSQYGSVRVREKSAELQRVAADAVKIAAEIIADKFPEDALLEMSGLEIPKRAEIEKRVAAIEKEAKRELEELGKKAEQAAQQMGQQAAQQQGGQQQPPDPAQAQAALQQAQQQVLAKYHPLLVDAQQKVPLEDVMKLLRDDRARNFVFEIESSSTILTDELQEKRSRNEFLTEFTGASQGLAGLMAMGEQGAKLAGAMLKFVLAPYRAGRDLDGAIDEFIDAAPEMAKAAAAKAGDDGGMAEANNKLAEAETVKAQAAMLKVQADAARAQADTQQKMADMQGKLQIEGDKHQRELQALQHKADTESAKLHIQITQMGQAGEKQQAEIDNLTAQTAKILASIGLDERKQQLSEYTAADQSQARQVDQALAVDKTSAENDFRERGEQRADRQQQFTEQQSSEGGQ